MIKPMKLKGYLRLEDDRSIVFESTIYDGSSFSIKPTQHDYELNEQFMPNKRRVEGWLYIQQESQQGDRVYVTLPQPSLQHGHHVLVKNVQLMPIGASINDFQPKTVSADEKMDLPDE